MKIRIAQASDKDNAICTLTLAFSMDPMVRWSIPQPAKYLAVFPAIAIAFGGTSFERKTAYVAEDFSGAALWLPPGATSDEEALLEVFDQNVGNEVKQDLPGIFQQMEKFRPTQPHWYLPMIGVDPTSQGTGIGSAMMTEALKVVDEDGLIAYLESSNPQNISLYERHGFEVIGEIQSGSSPVLRPMLRKAQLKKE